MSDAFFPALAREAAERYDRRDRFARHFARGKLTGRYADALAWQLLAPFALAIGVGDTWLDWRNRARPTS